MNFDESWFHYLSGVRMTHTQIINLIRSIEKVYENIELISSTIVLTVIWWISTFHDPLIEL